MTIALAALAILVPASVTLCGLLFKWQADKRLDEERKQAEAQLNAEKRNSEKRLELEREQEKARLRLEAAMRAAKLFVPSGSVASDSARTAAGLLALTELGFADLAIALLVDLWSTHHATASKDLRAAQGGPAQTFCVSTETAIQVIDAALENGPAEAQLMAAELLCRKAGKLEITNSLHWPSVVNSAWIETLPVAAKLLIVDALVQMALASPPTQNALRELAIRLYAISEGDREKRVKGCIGTLMDSIIPAVEGLGYNDFLMGPGHGFVKLKQLQDAASRHSQNPDGYLEKIVKNRSERLREWSEKCTQLSTTTGALAPACCTLREPAHAAA